MDDIHLSRLAQWVLRQIGKALLISMGVAVIFAALAAATPDSGWLPFAYIASPFAFGLTLYLSNAPLPPVDEEGDRIRNGLNNGQL